MSLLTIALGLKNWSILFQIGTTPIELGTSTAHPNPGISELGTSTAHPNPGISELGTSTAHPNLEISDKHLQLLMLQMLPEFVKLTISIHLYSQPSSDLR